MCQHVQVQPCVSGSALKRALQVNVVWCLPHLLMVYCSISRNEWVNAQFQTELWFPVYSFPGFQQFLLLVLLLLWTQPTDCSLHQFLVIRLALMRPMCQNIYFSFVGFHMKLSCISISISCLSGIQASSFPPRFLDVFLFSFAFSPSLSGWWLVCVQWFVQYVCMWSYIYTRWTPKDTAWIEIKICILIYFHETCLGKKKEEILKKYIKYQGKLHSKCQTIQKAFSAWSTNDSLLQF